VPAILVQWLLIGALWIAGGVFIAAAFYRADGLGGLAIFVGIVCAGISGVSFGQDWGPFGWVYQQVTGEGSVHAGIGVLLHLAMIAGLLALTW
jgi:hypothetical protein